MCTLPPFDTPEIKAAFWKERDTRLFFLRRLMLLAGIFSFAIFAVVEIVIVEENLSQILMMRAAATAVSLGLWAWFCATGSPGMRETLIGAIGIVFVLANLAMMTVSGPPLSDMLPFSIAMILAFGYGMLAPSFHTSLWTGLTAYVLYWITVSFTQISVASLVTNAHFLTLSIFAVLVGTFVREKLEREGANAQHELAKVNGELIEAGLAKDRLLASVSHELRTPVNAIAGFSEIMQQGLFGQVEPARYRSYVDDIQTSALLLKTGIDDLLDVSRLGVQKIAWEDSLTPVADIVSDSVAICQADATEAGITITLEPDLTSAAVRTDRQRLAQTLVNVIVNAIKFSGRGSEVRVGAQLGDAGGVIVSISDTGCGIAPDDLARIREPFGQVHSDQYSARKGGLGLGLAIATGFMERMDGRLDIESVPGKGTIVSIILPPDRVGPCAEKGRRSDRALSA